MMMVIQQGWENFEVRETVARSLLVAGAFRRRDKVVDKKSI